jgi:hypothetical protein
MSLLTVAFAHAYRTNYAQGRSDATRLDPASVRLAGRLADRWELLVLKKSRDG